MNRFNEQLVRALLWSGLSWFCQLLHRVALIHEYDADISVKSYGNSNGLGLRNAVATTAIRGVETRGTGAGALGRAEVLADGVGAAPSIIHKAIVDR
jgi:hypothetical protein